MAAISTHLHAREFQIATTKDMSLPLRKWWHKGTRWAVTTLSAVYECGLGEGKIVEMHNFDGHSIVFEFEDGNFVRVAMMGKLEK